MNNQSVRMECDSIMDISSVNLNLEELSGIDEVSMEMTLTQMTTPLTPAPEVSMAIQEEELSLEDFEMLNQTKQPSSVTTALSISLPPTSVESRPETRNREPFNPLANLKQALSIVPDTKAILNNIKRDLIVLSDKQSTLEVKLADLEMNIESRKMSISEETAKLQTAKEEMQIIEDKITAAQTKLKTLLRETEELKNNKGSSEKENIGEKSRVELYRQLTGVTFAAYNPNTPHELKGFAAGVGPTTNLKTFTFNTSEHSASLIGGYIWNVMEDMHEDNWKNLE